MSPVLIRLTLQCIFPNILEMFFLFLPCKSLSNKDVSVRITDLFSFLQAGFTNPLALTTKHSLCVVVWQLFHLFSFLSSLAWIVIKDDATPSRNVHLKQPTQAPTAYVKRVWKPEVKCLP